LQQFLGHCRWLPRRGLNSHRSSVRRDGRVPRDRRLANAAGVAGADSGSRSAAARRFALSPSSKTNSCLRISFTSPILSPCDRWSAKAKQTPVPSLSRIIPCGAPLTLQVSAPGGELVRETRTTTLDESFGEVDADDISARATGACSCCDLPVLPHAETGGSPCTQLVPLCSSGC